MHRDLKPANILITRESQTLKLIDFGLAKRISGADGHTLVRSHTCNVGTPRYMAPEVLASARLSSMVEYTEKADIFSAALIIWYLLTGHRPNCRGSEDLRARPDLEPARRRWEALAGLLERMWAHEAEARPSAEECVSAMYMMGLCGVGCGSGFGESCCVQ